MKQQIIDLVNEKHISSAGKCGMYFAEFTTKLNISLSEFEELITEMYNNEEIDIRNGINGFMVMKQKYYKQNYEKRNPNI